MQKRKTAPEWGRHSSEQLSANFNPGAVAIVAVSATRLAPAQLHARLALPIVLVDLQLHTRSVRRASAHTPAVAVIVAHDRGRRRSGRHRQSCCAQQGHTECFHLFTPYLVKSEQKTPRRAYGSIGNFFHGRLQNAE